MARENLKRIDILRHELKALRFILDNFHSGKIDRSTMPPREDFQSAQGRELYDIIRKSPSRAVAEEKIGALDSMTSISNPSCICRVSITTPIQRWYVSVPWPSVPAPSRWKACDIAEGREGPRGILFSPRWCGLIVVYQEKDTSWLGVLAFSSAAKAHEFVAASKLEVPISSRSPRQIRPRSRV